MIFLLGRKKRPHFLCLSIEYVGASIARPQNLLYIKEILIVVADNSILKKQLRIDYFSIIEM